MLRNWLTAAAFFVVLGLIGNIDRADASVTASVFDARSEPALGCWPWHPRYLAPGALVVAHKSLPCGTRLRICRQGRCVTARVRDRGPYVYGRELDLDLAVMRALRAPFGVFPVSYRRIG